MSNESNFKGSIKQLYTDAIMSHCTNEISQLEQVCISECRPIISKIESLVDDNSARKDVEDLVLDAAFIFAGNYYEAGFRKAMNIILDTLTGGATLQ